MPIPSYPTADWSPLYQGITGAAGSIASSFNKMQEEREKEKKKKERAENLLKYAKEEGTRLFGPEYEPSEAIANAITTDAERMNAGTIRSLMNQERQDQERKQKEAEQAAQLQRGTQGQPAYQQALMDAGGAQGVQGPPSPQQQTMIDAYPQMTDAQRVAMMSSAQADDAAKPPTQQEQQQQEMEERRKDADSLIKTHKITDPTALSWMESYVQSGTLGAKQHALQFAGVQPAGGEGSKLTGTQETKVKGQYREQIINQSWEVARPGLQQTFLQENGWTEDEVTSDSAKSKAYKSYMEAQYGLMRAQKDQELLAGTYEAGDDRDRVNAIYDAQIKVLEAELEALKLEIRGMSQTTPGTMGGLWQGQ